MQNYGSTIISIARYEMLWDLRKYRTAIMVLAMLLVSVGFGYIQPELVFTSAQKSSLGGTWWLQVIGQYEFTTIFIGLVPLLAGGTLSTDTISQEFDRGTIIPLLSQPVSRAQVFFGKFLEKAILCAAFSVLVVVSSVASTYAIAGTVADLSFLPYIFLSVILTFLGFSAIGMLMSSFLKNSSLVFGIMIGLLIFMGALYIVLVFLLKSYSPFLNAVPMVNNSILPGAISQYLESPGSTFPFSASTFGSGRTELVGVNSYFFSALVFVAVEIALFVIAAYLIFRRREVT